MLSTLSYIAVFHFIKQQIGFVMLYQKHEEIPNQTQYVATIFDKVITWVITGFPFLYWVTHYEIMEINWFTYGEFSLLSQIVPKLEFLWILYFIFFILYIISQLILILLG